MCVTSGWFWYEIKKKKNICARPAETEFYVISSVGAFFLLLFCRYLKATGRKNEVRADA